jgi:pimeloyl-ACP methyl ester carboxylesterase
VATVVGRYHDGPELLDALVALSVFDPTYPGVPAALDAAAHGRPASLDRLIRGVQAGEEQTPAIALSQGLHASTLCADTHFPWGGAATPVARRAQPLARAVARIPPAELWPFDRATAAGNGFVRQCLPWPATPGAPPPPPAHRLPDVPVLLLGGDRDLSTPLAWTREEARRAPHGRLVVVGAAGHSVQLRARSAAGRVALIHFLQGR